MRDNLLNFISYNSTAPHAVNKERLEDLIKILLEPDNEMLDAGRELQSMGDETLDRADMLAKWQAMVRKI